MRYCKKALCALLTFCMILSMMPAGAFAAEADSIDAETLVQKELNEKTPRDRVAYEVTGGNIYFDSDKGEVTDCDTSVTEAIIPSKIEGKSVTGIGLRAFEDCVNLTSIEIPSSVTTIGSEAFHRCKNLTDVIIPSSVTTIPGHPFSGCDGLTSAGPIGGNYSIKFGWTEKIPEMVFGYCCNLTSIVIPATITEIGGYAFRNCSNLRSIELPPKITIIGSYMFTDCSSLTNIVIPFGVTSIGDYAFHGCSSLTCLEIPSSVTTIGYNSFGNCSSLVDITIPSSIKTMPKQVFSGCSGLTSAGPIGGNYAIKFGWTEKFPDNALNSCDYLTNITIPDTIVEIGEYAFFDCNKLMSIELPPSVISIGNHAFEWCRKLENVIIPSGVTSINNSVFEGCSSLTDVTMPSGITSIGYSSFKDCRSLVNIAIPSGVTSIGSSAFYNCGNLTNITIPAGVTHLNSYVFYGCGLTDIQILSTSITNIDDDAFRHCDNLKDITIPSGVTRLGVRAFYECDNLMSITIPFSVTNICTDAFAYCKSLTDVYYTGTQQQWDAIAIEDHTAPLIDAEIHYNTTDPILKPGVEPDSPYIVALLTSYDSTSKQVVLGGDTLTVYQITEETDKPSVDNLPNLTGTYVLVTYSEVDTSTRNVKAIYPLKAVSGALTKCDPAGVTVNEKTYLVAPSWASGTMPDYTGQFCFCLVLNDTVMQIFPAKYKKGKLEHITNKKVTISKAEYPICIESISTDLSEMESWLNHTIGYWIANGTVCEIEITNPIFGSCGDNLTWEISDGILTISGNGKMTEYSDAKSAPWYNYKNTIKSIIIEAGVASISNYAFHDEGYPLTNIHFRGDAPSFKDDEGKDKNSIFRAYRSIMAYYPPENKTWTDDVKKRYGGRIIWYVELPPIPLGKLQLQNVWNFGNISSEIPLEKYKLFFGPLIAKHMHVKDNGEGGQCQGMCTTAVCTYYGMPPVTVFGANYKNLSNVSITDTWAFNDTTAFTAEDYIHYGHIFQYKPENIAKEISTINRLEYLHDAVATYMAGNGEPPMIGIWGVDLNDNDISHAILALSLTDYNDYSIIECYDPNYPSLIRQLYLYKKDGKFISWEYTYNHGCVWGTGQKNAKISYNTYSRELYSCFITSMSKKGLRLMLTDAQSLTIKNSDNTVTATAYESDNVNLVTPIFSLNSAPSKTRNAETTSEPNYYWVNMGENLTFTNVEENSDIQIVADNNGIDISTSEQSNIEMFIADEGLNQSVEITTNGEKPDNNITLAYHTIEDGENIKTTEITAVAASKLKSSETENGIDVSGVTDLTIKINNDIVNLPDLNKESSYLIDINDDGNKIISVKEAGLNETDYNTTIYPNPSSNPGIEKPVTPPIHNSNGSSGGGSSLSSNKVSVVSGSNGSVTMMPKTPKKGDTVTVTAKPDEGYVLNTLEVTDSSGKTIDVTKLNDNEFTFVMPTGDVTVTPVFAELTPEPQKTETAFADVPADAYYADAVAWALSQGITNGTSGTTFSPGNSCTRAQMVTFLWRSAGSPYPQNKDNPFADVTDEAYYYDAVLWAVEHGITTGTGEKNFSPENTVTRGQTVTFLHRMAGMPETSAANPFTDVEADSFYSQAAIWAAEQDITKGTTDTTFSPNDSCTRGQIVTFLYRNSKIK